MVQNTTGPRPGATSAPERPSLFGPPALSPEARARRASPPSLPPVAVSAAPLAPQGPRVSAVATGAFKMGRERVAAVDVHVSGMIFSLLVRGSVVVPPMRRGEIAVTFTDPALEHAVENAAVEAAQHAEARGWLA